MESENKYSHNACILGKIENSMIHRGIHVILICLLVTLFGQMEAQDKKKEWRDAQFISGYYITHDDDTIRCRYLTPAIASDIYDKFTVLTDNGKTKKVFPSACKAITIGSDRAYSYHIKDVEDRYKFYLEYTYNNTIVLFTRVGGSVTPTPGFYPGGGTSSYYVYIIRKGNRECIINKPRFKFSRKKDMARLLEVFPEDKALTEKLLKISKIDYMETSEPLKIIKNYYKKNG